MKSCAPSLAFITRFTATRKWPNDASVRGRYRSKSCPRRRDYYTGAMYWFFFFGHHNKRTLQFNDNVVETGEAVLPKRFLCAAPFSPRISQIARTNNKYTHVHAASCSLILSVKKRTFMFSSRDAPCNDKQLRAANSL